ncbi:MAG: DUF4864 domain-containing protein [Candidatus Poriferisodalaceae bacterium]
MNTQMAPREAFRRLTPFKISLAAFVLISLSGCGSNPSQAATQGGLALKPTTSVTSTSVASTSIVSDDLGCEEGPRDALQKRISAQNNALSRGAFEDAREFASPSFRQNVDPSAFQALIESGFPFLLKGNPAAFGRCQIVDDTATIEVRFADDAPVTLVYFLIWWEDQWWIDAASPAVDSLRDKVEAS